jgi:hypothetical protein
MYVFLSFVVVSMLQSQSVVGGALECPSDTTGHSFTYTSGAMMSAWCALVNDLKHGPSRSYYSNGQLTFVGEYVDGAAHATAVYYLNDGTIWRRDLWNEGALVSKWLNPETMVLSREEMLRRGAVDVGNDVGRITACAPLDRRPECKPALPSPVVVLRYTNGRRRARGAVSDGLRTDRWTYWYASGALAKRAEFFGGQLSGVYQEWYENGRPSSEGEYLSGEKVGVWLYWSRTGKIRRERHGSEADQRGYADVAGAMTVVPTPWSAAAKRLASHPTLRPAMWLIASA